jgi:adenine phosphoribosyltransferase
VGSKDQSVHDLLAEMYREASVVQNGEYWTTINRFTDHTEPLSPEVLLEVGRAIVAKVPSHTSIILDEEEKGAYIATTVSILTRIPLVLARYYTYPIERNCSTSISSDIQHEYYSGKLVVNGLRKNQTITIVEDTISTGGTIRALAHACKQVGANVAAVVAVVEKVNYGGRQVVKECLGVDLSSIVRIRVGPKGVRIASKEAWSGDSAQ